MYWVPVSDVKLSPRGSHVPLPSFSIKRQYKRRVMFRFQVDLVVGLHVVVRTGNE